MPRITIDISRDAADTLIRLAQSERRRPRDQAAFLLERRLGERQQDAENDRDGRTSN